MKQNNQTLVSKLGLPVAAPKTPGQSPRVLKFNAWKAAREQGNQAAGYDSSSPIYGKTDLEAIQQIRDLLAAYFNDNGGTAMSHADVVRADEMLAELLKRKVGRQLAGQTYRNSK